MHIINRSLLALFVASIILMLNACTTTPSTIKTDADEIITDTVTLKKYDTNKFLDKEVREKLVTYANKNVDVVSDKYLFRTAKELFETNQPTEQSETDIELESERSKSFFSGNIQIQLLAAKIALISDLPEKAIELLPELDILSSDQLIEANTIRAEAFIKTGNYLDAIRAHINNSHLTGPVDEKEKIHQTIWSILSSLPDVYLQNLHDNDPVLKGWIELTTLLRNAQIDITWLQQDILDWKTKYLSHPAYNTFVDNLLNEYSSEYAKYNNIALFLPSEGPYQGVAEVISNGFLSAYYDNESTNKKPNIRFYDTSNKNLNFDALYQQAITDGAEIIIGPINKSLIDKLTNKNEFNIPILTLNYAENPKNNTVNLFQFGLLPEDEAQHVAELAKQKNNKYAAVLTPKSEWGDRLGQSFTQHFEKLGGKVVSTKQYATGIDDFSAPIRQLLNINDSDKRFSRIKNLLKTDVKFTPYRRQDVDMIFVAATQRSARGIIPALKFHHAADVQTYATSHVYSGQPDPKTDRDLNGLLMCDIPWTLVSSHNLKNTFKENWKNKEEYTRLFALGVDAFSLLNNLSYLKNNQRAYFAGQTGNIYLDDNNRLHRNLIWAQFIRGKPVYRNPNQIPNHVRKQPYSQPAT